jgi:hypothetical protein
VPEFDEFVTGGVWVAGVVEVPLFTSFVVPVLVPLWPDGLLVVPEPIDEPEVELASEPIDLHPASDSAMMPPSRTVWNLFIRILLDVVGSDHHARTTSCVK